MLPRQQKERNAETMISFALILMTLPSRVAEAQARRTVFSANGSFPAWGSAPGKGIPESAIQLRAVPGVLSRAFSANTRFASNPGAMPEAIIEKAPLALKRCPNGRGSTAADGGSYNASGDYNTKGR
jgi:hypothetical protein